jgi:hypothetical protein
MTSAPSGPGPAPRLDADTIAAFLDGRLDPDERARVLRTLAESEPDQEILAEAAAVLAALADDDAGGAGDADAAVLPLQRRHGGRRGLTFGLLLAAVLAGLLAIPLLLLRPDPATDPGPAAGAQRYAALLAPRAQALPGGWEHPPWRTVRAPGAEPARLLAPEALAFRLGARLTAAEFAAAAGLHPRTADFAAEAAELAAGLPGGAPLAALYRELAENPVGPRADELLEHGWTAALGAGHEAWVRLGAWAEGARLASLAEDAAFFAAGPAARELAALAAAPWPAPVHSALAEVRAVVAGGVGAEGWPAVRGAVEDLFLAAAG